MTPENKKRLLLIVVGFAVIIILLTQLSPPPRHGTRATKQTTAPLTATEAPVATTPGATTSEATSAPPTQGGLTNALKANKFKPMSFAALSGPPRNDIFVRVPLKSSSVSKKPQAGSATSSSKPAGVSTKPVAPPPPSLKLLGTVVAPSAAAAVLEVGQERIYVEPGDTIPYGKDTLVVSTILPEQVQCVTSVGTKMLQIARL